MSCLAGCFRRSAGVDILAEYLMMIHCCPPQAHMFRAETDWHTDRTLHGNRSGHSSGHGSGNSMHSAGGAGANGAGAGGGFTSGGLMYSHNTQRYLEHGEIEAVPGEDYGAPELPPTALQQFPSRRYGDQVPIPFGAPVMEASGAASGGSASSAVGVREGGAGQPIVRSNSELFERDCEAGDSIRGGMRVIPSVGSAPVTAGELSHDARYSFEEGLPSALAATAPHIASRGE